MNSEETGIQSILCGTFGEKIETPDSKQFQIHSVSTNYPFSIKSESDLKEEMRYLRHALGHSLTEQ